jgi:hypothetical protein
MSNVLAYFEKNVTDKHSILFCLFCQDEGEDRTGAGSTTSARGAPADSSTGASLSSSLSSHYHHTIVTLSSLYRHTIVTLSSHYRHTLASGVIDANENKLECLSLFNLIVSSSYGLGLSLSS